MFLSLTWISRFLATESHRNGNISKYPPSKGSLYCIDFFVFCFLFFVFFLKILFIYLTEIETASERGNTSRGRGRGRSRLIAEEPDVGLDPRSPGSRPEPKADA